MIGLEVFSKLILAIIFSGLIGLEREIRERPAGLRTHILVCLGATLITLVAQDYFTVNVDSVARVVAGIITGIGFLGAGTIISSHHHVRGLTTAAGLWVVAGIGIVLGLGYYFIASLASALILIVLKLYKLECYIHSKK